jgi:hypothetical protein
VRAQISQPTAAFITWRPVEPQMNPDANRR